MFLLYRFCVGRLGGIQEPALGGLNGRSHPSADRTTTSRRSGSGSSGSRSRSTRTNPHPFDTPTLPSPFPNPPQPRYIKAGTRWLSAPFLKPTLIQIEIEMQTKCQTNTGTSSDTSRIGLSDRVKPFSSQPDSMFKDYGLRPEEDFDSHDRWSQYHQWRERTF